MNIDLKNPEELKIMRRANLLVFEVLNAIEALIKPGVSTWDLNQLAAQMTEEAGARSAFLHYPASSPETRPFPAVICSSVNDEIVHGIPNKNPLKSGDIVSVDFGCELNGFFGDSARTFAVGTIDQKAERLLEVTKASLEAAISQCVSGNRIGDISNAVQSIAEGAGFGVVREFVGHGIGRKMHEPPQVPNFGRPHMGRVLRPGMVLAIEPMITIGSYETKLLEDGWTAVTKDGSLSAHFEHTVAITESGPWVLSRPD